MLARSAFLQKRPDITCRAKAFNNLLDTLVVSNYKSSPGAVHLFATCWLACGCPTRFLASLTSLENVETLKWFTRSLLHGSIQVDLSGSATSRGFSFDDAVGLG